MIRQGGTAAFGGVEGGWGLEGKGRVVVERAVVLEVGKGESVEGTTLMEMGKDWRMRAPGEMVGILAILGCAQVP